MNRVCHRTRIIHENNGIESSQRLKSILVCFLPHGPTQVFQGPVSIKANSRGRISSQLADLAGGMRSFPYSRGSGEGEYDGGGPSAGHGSADLLRRWAPDPGISRYLSEIVSGYELAGTSFKSEVDLE